MQSRFQILFCLPKMRLFSSSSVKMISLVPGFRRMFALPLAAILFQVPAFAALTWETFIPKALETSPDVRQTRLQFEVVDLPTRQAEFQLDWIANFEAGAERDRRVTMVNRVFDLDERFRTTGSLTKSFLTGTDLSLEVASEDLHSTSTLIVASRDGVFHSYLLTLEQNLWRNAFGQQWRSLLEAADSETRARRHQSLEETENALLRGAQLFWQAAVLERQYRESEAALKRWEALVSNVERKNRVRYAAPGELAQVQAQYHGRVRQARENRINFERAFVNLKVYLPEIEMSDLRWKEKFPKFGVRLQSSQHDITRTRAYELASLRERQLRAQAESVESRNKPQVALVGRVGATGIDTTTDASRQQWLEGDRPLWFIGVRLNHRFGSGFLDSEVKQAKAQARAQEIATVAEKERLRLLKEQIEGAIESLEQSIQAQNEELVAQRRAVQELTRAFNQGRIDISILIETINRAETAEVEQVQTRADLELAYLQWQFLFDKIDL